VRLLVADDHDIIRRGLRALLETRPDLRVVAEASTGREALAMAIETRPDIMIVDYILPELNGRDLTIALKKELPRIEVLIYTMHDRQELIIEALRAGARGFVLKSDTDRHLFAAIDALSVGRSYISGVISDALLDQHLHSKPQASLSPLTDRERQVVQLIAEGKMNKQIAQTLDIAIKTVETHRASVMQKLNLRTTAQLVRYAIRNDITGA
jgi:DNA-binding NarL/FixJ family response regulator